MFNKLFDFNRDGNLNAAERALEYMNFRAVTGESDDPDNDEFDFEEDNDDGEDDF